MKKIWLFAALLIGVLHLFWFTSPAMALTDQVVPPPMPSPSIKLKATSDYTSLSEIDYWVSSSGPSSSIRYKTLDYYITLHNPDGSTTAFSFQPSVAPPPPGQTVIDKFTVTAADLQGAGFPASSLLLQNLSSISLSATIAIYNASTGEILSTFGDQNSMSATIDPVIDQVAGSYGFGPQDIADMKTRYVDSLLGLLNPTPGGTCSLAPGSGTVLSQEHVSGQWSFPYWGWVSHSSTSCSTDSNGVETCTTDSWSTCEITGSESGTYYEKLWMSISPPDPATVKAGQGAAVTVTTWYENNNPTAWNGSSYANGVQSVTMSGPNTEDWATYKLNNTRMTENMVLKSSRVVYNYYYPQTYSTGCNGGWFNVGYNVPVVEQTWVIPYARFDNNGWTLQQNPPTDIDNRYVFGGLNRWYFGFDIPDGQNFPLQFMAQGGISHLSDCGSAQVGIKGTPYDDFYVTTIDPNNPFPGGKPTPWQGFETYITNLKTWFREPQIVYQQKLAEWKNMSVTQMIHDFFVGHMPDGLKRLNGH